MKLTFDPEQIRLGDLDVFEALTGKTFEEVIQAGPSGAAQYKGIYYLVMRQNDQEFKEESLPDVTLGELFAVAEAMKAAMADPPTGAAAS